MQVFFEQKRELTPGVWQFDFQPARPLQFEPGQYVDLRLGVDSPRTFTLTTLPGEPRVSFVTKLPSPMSAYKLALAALKPGDSAEFTEAMGDFVLPKSLATPLVFVAGGIGIASYVSIARWLTSRQERRLITAFYSVRSRKEIIFQEEIMPAFTPQVILAPQRLTAQAILKAAAPNSLIYLSGSQVFVETLRAELLKLGVEAYRVIFEYYSGYLEL